MILKTDSIENLRVALSENCERIEGFELSELNNLIEHVPEDMTATVQAGMTVENFQAQLAKRNQLVTGRPALLRRAVHRCVVGGKQQRAAAVWLWHNS